MIGKLTREKALAEIDVLAAKCEPLRGRIERLPSGDKKDQLLEQHTDLHQTFITARRVMNENWLDHRRAELANMELRGDLTSLVQEIEAAERDRHQNADDVKTRQDGDL
jgi:hypothetical protein